MRTWIKFCGTTCLEDARASIEAGADALGFIFAPSRRRISPEKARVIVGKLPDGVETIGVFLEAGEEMRTILAQVELTGIQLHGDHNADEVYDFLPPKKRGALRVIRTILIKGDFERRLDESLAATNAADNWLLDSGAGSGKTFDWQGVREVMSGREGRFIIAGGLNPGNVGEAIEMFSPWGVDVVSGIESEPGRKDPEKMRAFVDAVRKAGQK